MKFEPPDIMGIPPEELKTILSLPGDEHFRSESLDRVALTSGSLPCKWRERDIKGATVARTHFFKQIKLWLALNGTLISYW